MNEGEALDEMLAIVREHDLDALIVRTSGATYELVARAEAPAFRVVLKPRLSPARPGQPHNRLRPPMRRK